MDLSISLPKRLAALLILGLVAAPAAVADVTAVVNPGQRIVGEVPTRLDLESDPVRRVSELIRIQLPLVAGAEPRLKLTLRGSPVVVSFRTTQLFDPDGELVASSPDGSTGPRFTQRIRSGRSTLVMRGYEVEKTGTYELRIDTNAAVTTEVSGKLRVKRRKKVKFVGTPEDLVFAQDFLDGDKVKLIVKGHRKRGPLPDVLSFADPEGTTLQLREGFSKRTTKSGAKSALLEVRDTGEHRFQLGYQVGSAEEEFKGVLKLVPAEAKNLTRTVQIRLANPPGVELGVREADRRIEPTFGTQGDTGVAFVPGLTNGGIVHVSGEDSGDVLLAQYTPDLAPVLLAPTIPQIARVAGVVHSDTPAGDPVLGNRVVFSPDFGWIYVGWTTQSGTRLGLTQVRPRDYVRNASVEVQAQSPDPIADAFLLATDTKLFQGFFVAPDAHRIIQLAPDGSLETTFAVGGGAFGHAGGAVATFDRDADRIEFFVPDTLNGSAPGGIHRQLYNDTWVPIVNDELVDEVGVTEFQSTAATRVEIASGNVATVLHYVVDGGADGDGQIHRRLFDSSGAEIPGSAAVVATPNGTPRTGLSRPSSAFGTTSSGAPVLFLSYTSPQGPVVERLPLVITPLD